MFGFRRPKAELRQTWNADAEGRPRGERDPPGFRMFQSIMTSTKTYSRIPAPALVVFAPPHLPEAWIGKSADPRVQESARNYYAAIDAATTTQAAALEAAVPTARVVRMRGAHHIFLSNEAEIVREVRRFLNGLR